MVVNIDNSKKFVDLLLANEEDAPDVSGFHLLFPDYDITIFRSGHGDLGLLTANLLSANK